MDRPTRDRGVGWEEAWRSNRREPGEHPGRIVEEHRHRAVREADRKGLHTSPWRRLVRAEGGARLLDGNAETVVKTLETIRDPACG